MNYKYKKRVTQSAEVELQIQKHKENELNKLELSGLSKESIEELKFKEKNKLNFPCDDYNLILSQVLGEIFKNISTIHTDILISMVKGITAIDIIEVIQDKTADYERMEAYSQKILDVVIANMEMLYYFNEDETFSQLVFDLCTILDLNPENYGFNMTELRA